MQEIQCPHCGKAFTIDEAGYAAIVQQVRDREFNQELARQTESAVKLSAAEKDAAITGLKREQKVRSLVSQSGAREQDVVFRLLDMDKVKQEEDGSLSGIQEQLDELKKKSAYLFGHGFSPKGGFDGPRENPKKPSGGSNDVNAAIRAAFGR